MSLARPLFAISLVALAASFAACGSDGGGSGYGPKGSTREETATATTPAAPPGASARSCGGSVAGTSQVRVTGVACDAGLGVVATWAAKPACAPASGESRASCPVGDGYRCLAATVEQGVAVSCSAPGRSISFLARQG